MSGLPLHLKQLVERVEAYKTVMSNLRTELQNIQELLKKSLFVGEEGQLLWRHQRYLINEIRLKENQISICRNNYLRRVSTKM